MEKTNNLLACAHYVAPGCKVVEMKVRRVMCGSQVVGKGFCVNPAIEDQYDEDF